MRALYPLFKNASCLSWFIFFTVVLYGQAATCLCNNGQMNATPFCTDQNPYGLSYSAGTSGYATELYYLNSTGCIDRYNGGDRPAWFKMKISQAGNLNIFLSHSGGGDIDYACWGPFTDDDMANMCTSWTSTLRNYLYDNLSTDYSSTYYSYYYYTNGLQIFSHHPTYHDYMQSYPYANTWYVDWYNPNPSGKLVDCSSTPSPTEWIHIRNAQVGQWYIVLISNWEGVSGNINFSSDASSTAETDCSITAPVIGDEVCEGDTAVLTAQASSGAVHYAWTGPNGFSQTTATNTLTFANVTMSQAGQYSMRVWNGGSYGATTTCELIVHPRPDLALQGATICSGQPATLSVTGADSYLWNTGSTDSVMTVIPMQTTTYTVTGTTAGMCTATISATVVVNDSVWVELFDTICQGESYSENGFTAATDEPGDFTYEHNGQTLSGCDSVTTLHLTVLPVFLQEERADVCYGESYAFFDDVLTSSGVYDHHFTTISGCDSLVRLHLSVHPNYTIDDDKSICRKQLPYYYWPADTTFGEETPEDGTYVFSRQTVAGCDSTITLTLKVVESFLELNNLTEDFCEDHEALLQANTTMENLYWSTGETTPDITVTHPGTYIVTAYTGQCQEVAQVFIPNCDFNMYLPNAITPSVDDGVNDVFCIPQFIADQISNVELYIYDRWGMLVYKSNDPHFQWDGSVNGKILTNTVYTYRLSYFDVNDLRHIQQGVLTVL